MRRVVITGMGVLSPNASTIGDYWDALVHGRGAVSRITHFDPSAYTSKIAAEVQHFDPTLYMPPKEAKRLIPVIQFALAAAKMALDDSGLVITDTNADRIGVVVGSGIGGISFMEEQARNLHEKGPSRVSPFAVPWMISNMSAGEIAILHGMRGPNTSPTTACATSTHAVGDAYRIIQRGEADAVLAGGTEAAITPLGIAAFCAAKALSTRNEDPEHASRPFDKERNGFVMGEGSGIVILEELEHARKRGGRIYAEVVGYSMNGDAYHITAPNPLGKTQASAITLALQDAKIAPESVDYINAHGTSTQLNDAGETKAIKMALGEAARTISISSTKSMVGNLLGAAGGIELVATILCMKHGTVHQTIKYHTPAPECDLDYTPNQPRERKIRYAMSNSFGFGCHNAVLIVKKFE
jgi:3-oxoacyl-[acyl-carrier-protein] synthase II